MARYREEGRCDDYRRAVQSFESDIRAQWQFRATQLELDGDRRAYNARGDVLSYFEDWPRRLENSGCTPAITPASAPSAPSQAALAPLSPVPEMQSDFHPNTYEIFRDKATELATLRSAGRCGDYWARLRSFEEELAASREVAVRRDPGQWSRTGPHDYFDSWVSQARRRGCGDTARAP
jgi:hypothetical protein